MLYVYRKAVRSVEASAPRWRVESNEALIFVSPLQVLQVSQQAGIIITFISLRFRDFFLNLICSAYI